jgi:hypothetical protein
MRSARAPSWARHFLSVLSMAMDDRLDPACSPTAPVAGQPARARPPASRAPAWTPRRSTRASRTSRWASSTQAHRHRRDPLHGLPRAQVADGARTDGGQRTGIRRRPLGLRARPGRQLRELTLARAWLLRIGFEMRIRRLSTAPSPPSANTAADHPAGARPGAGPVRNMTRPLRSSCAPIIGGYRHAEPGQPIVDGRGVAVPGRRGKSRCRAVASCRSRARHHPVCRRS